jgi:hypothetical protein
MGWFGRPHGGNDNHSQEANCHSLARALAIAGMLLVDTAISPFSSADHLS